MKIEAKKDGWMDGWMKKRKKAKLGTKKRVRKSFCILVDSLEASFGQNVVVFISYCQTSKHLR